MCIEGMCTRVRGEKWIFPSFSSSFRPAKSERATHKPRVRTVKSRVVLSSRDALLTETQLEGFSNRGRNLFFLFSLRRAFAICEHRASLSHGQKFALSALRLQSS
jgi:hypothetical protein